MTGHCGATGPALSTQRYRLSEPTLSFTELA